MISVNKLAKYIIWYANQKHIRISQLKLQKILFFTQIEYIKKNNKLLFPDIFEVWKYGPTIPDIYYEYCAYGALGLRSYDEADGMIAEDVAINTIIDPLLRQDCSSLVHNSITEVEKIGEKNISGETLLKLYAQKT